jgi:hypothetical protein
MVMVLVVGISAHHERGPRFIYQSAGIDLGY